MMYDGTAEWGTPIARNVIDLRAAFTLGDGIQAVDKDDTADSKREAEFIKGFLDINGFDEDCAQDWAKEVEIEGKSCALFSPDDDLSPTFRTGPSVFEVCRAYCHKMSRLCVLIL